jgi:hypothetical protein
VTTTPGTTAQPQKPGGPAPTTAAGTSPPTTTARPSKPGAAAPTTATGTPPTTTAGAGAASQKVTKAAPPSGSQPPGGNQPPSGTPKDGSAAATPAAPAVATITEANVKYASGLKEYAISDPANKDAEHLVKRDAGGGKITTIGTVPSGNGTVFDETAYNVSGDVNYQLFANLDVDPGPALGSGLAVKLAAVSGANFKVSHEPDFRSAWTPIRGSWRASGDTYTQSNNAHSGPDINDEKSLWTGVPSPPSGQTTQVFTAAVQVKGWDFNIPDYHPDSTPEYRIGIGFSSFDAQPKGIYVIIKQSYKDSTATAKIVDQADGFKFDITNPPSAANTTLRLKMRVRTPAGSTTASVGVKVWLDSEHEPTDAEFRGDVQWAMPAAPAKVVPVVVGGIAGLSAASGKKLSVVFSSVVLESLPDQTAAAAPGPIGLSTPQDLPPPVLAARPDEVVCIPAAALTRPGVGRWGTLISQIEPDPPLPLRCVQSPCRWQIPTATQSACCGRSSAVFATGFPLGFPGHCTTLGEMPAGMIENTETIGPEPHLHTDQPPDSTGPVEMTPITYPGSAGERNHALPPAARTSWKPARDPFVRAAAFRSAGENALPQDAPPQAAPPEAPPQVQQQEGATKAAGAPGATPAEPGAVATNSRQGEGAPMTTTPAPPPTVVIPESPTTPALSPSDTPPTAAGRPGSVHVPLATLRDHGAVATYPDALPPTSTRSPQAQDYVADALVVELARRIKPSPAEIDEVISSTTKADVKKPIAEQLKDIFIKVNQRRIDTITRKVPNDPAIPAATRSLITSRLKVYRGNYMPPALRDLFAAQLKEESPKLTSGKDQLALLGLLPEVAASWVGWQPAPPARSFDHFSAKRARRLRDAFTQLPEYSVVPLTEPSKPRSLLEPFSVDEEERLPVPILAREDPDHVWTYYFDHPARFPRASFGRNCCAVEGEGAVIHEGMRLLAGQNGRYEVRFNITTPSIPVALRLQLILFLPCPEDPALPQPVPRTLTLPPIAIEPAGDDAFPLDLTAGTRPTSYMVSIKGYSQVIQEALDGGDGKQLLLVKRIGTARMGHGVQYQMTR